MIYDGIVHPVGRTQVKEFNEPRLIDSQIEIEKNRTQELKICK